MPTYHKQFNMGKLLFSSVSVHHGMEGWQNRTIHRTGYPDLPQPFYLRFWSHQWTKYLLRSDPSRDYGNTLTVTLLDVLLNLLDISQANQVKLNHHHIQCAAVFLILYQVTNYLQYCGLKHTRKRFISYSFCEFEIWKWFGYERERPKQASLGGL